MARIEPLPAKKWPAEMREAFAALVPPAPRHTRSIQEGAPKARNALGTFAHHPDLARAFFTLNGHVLLATTLAQRQTELLVLRVAARRKCDYVWAQHVLVGRDAGLTDEEIDKVTRGPAEPSWSPLDAALLRAVDELLDDGAIGDETWAALTAALDTQQLMDLIFTVGAFEASVFLMNSFAFDLDDDLRPT
ncbi:carboxymuconolactone decarboxylase [Parafrankia soli]|uniref:Carboxymuconolactone decarboxylase n=1 Tax=Parafrankia soli TaxID=2599596 RepID=A0A1S1QED0_9ACTN|nr:carboxymuconolactone decarboxylase family protein [Parafrankia soli]OHV31585.1 carboxymuconolactone decarboxylase [Parafrankia soli]